MADTRSADARRSFWRRYYRPPFIGVIAFFAVLLALPLAHSFVILVRDLIGYENAAGWLVGLLPGADHQVSVGRVFRKGLVPEPGNSLA
ncbi:MAG: hypothetical protein F4X06_00800 [Gammaproteobacteria bacterium]|nr:hypothetical protein [Gammaproteobacteria bacterium]MYD00871.1 hypothetical protein [Gammaproteobacteria bacterium]